MDNRPLKAKNNESGTITALLTAAEVTTAHVSPVPENAPGMIFMNPGTSEEECIYYKERDAGLGTISGLTRDFENQNGGIGREAQANAPWETLQSTRYLNNLIDMFIEGYSQEMNDVAYVSAASFTVKTNRAIFYTSGRIIRFSDNSTAVVSANSTYSAGTGLTTVLVVGTVPADLSTVEIGIQAKGLTQFLVKGSGSDINTGTNDTYYITAKAIADSTLAFLSDITFTPSSADTVTNKRIEPRIVTATSYTTDTGTSLSVATADVFQVTAQAGALKFNNPGGTPVAGQKLIIRIKDNGTARALTYDTQFRASSDLDLPTTTVLNKTLYMGFIFNATDTKWDLLAVMNNF